MTEYQNLPQQDLQKLRQELITQYEQLQARGLHLDMSRGKPAPSQLDLSEGLLTKIAANEDCISENGTDTRNYGVLEGLPEARQLFAEMLGVTPDEIFIGGNSSLNLMFDTISRAYCFGLLGEQPWCRQGTVKFLCPVPGYDRHFAITETFGIEMISIPMTSDGPDMDLVAQYVEQDPLVKGIWCVPMYSNPDGITYSDETVRRFAALKPAAKDFRIFWDNAYGVHHLYEDHDSLLNLMEECKKVGTEDMVFEFASTSKISFSGAGLAAFACSLSNMAWMKKFLTVQTIGSDKINQLRHIRFFKNFDGLQAHMLKHRALIAPKFEIVLDKLSKEIAPLGIASWHEPKGGYFLSVNTLPGCAKRTVQLCGDAGVALTAAGAAFPYGEDPLDRNIRLAPTFPSTDELIAAMDAFCLCLRLATVEMLLAGEKER